MAIQLRHTASNHAVTDGVQRIDFVSVAPTTTPTVVPDESTAGAAAVARFLLSQRRFGFKAEVQRQGSLCYFGGLTNLEGLHSTKPHSSTSSDGSADPCRLVLVIRGRAQTNYRISCDKIYSAGSIFAIPWAPVGLFSWGLPWQCWLGLDSGVGSEASGGVSGGVRGGVSIRQQVRARRNKRSRSPSPGTPDHTASMGARSVVGARTAARAPASMGAGVPGAMTAVLATASMSA